MHCHRLLLRRMMTLGDFFDCVRETHAADLASPRLDVRQEGIVRWVHAFDTPESEGRRSVVLWVKAPHWAYPVSFFACGIESPEVLQLRDTDNLPLDIYLGRGEISEALTPEDLELADVAVQEFVAAMQR